MAKPGYDFQAPWVLQWSLPPRPNYVACIASGLERQEWIALPGSQDFDLVIEPHSVYVTYVGPNPQIVIVWSEPHSHPLNVPTSLASISGISKCLSAS